MIAALADDGLWAVDVSGDRLLEIDRRHQRVGRAVRVDGLPTGVAAAGGRLWVMGQEFASVTVIDARSLERVAVLRFAPSELWPAGIIAGPRGIWLITGWRDELSLIDPRTLDGHRPRRDAAHRSARRNADSLWAIAPPKMAQGSFASIPRPSRPPSSICRGKTLSLRSPAGKPSR